MIMKKAIKPTKRLKTDEFYKVCEMLDELEVIKKNVSNGHYKKEIDIAINELLKVRHIFDTYKKGE